MSDFSEFSGIDSHCPELLLRCVRTLEMDDKAKFEEEEDKLCLHTDGLERKMSACDTTFDARMVGWVSSVYRHSPSRIQTHVFLSVSHPRPAHPLPLEPQAALPPQEGAAGQNKPP